MQENKTQEFTNEEISKFRETLNKPIVQYAYIKEILFQSEGITESVKELNDFLTGVRSSELIKMSHEEREKIIYKLFRILQSLSLSVGMVSKLLAPINSKSDTLADIRSKKLIELLNLNSLIQLKPNQSLTSLLIEIRELRNHLEHFDERFDIWTLKNNISPIFLVDLNMGKIEDIRLLFGDMNYKILRFFDIYTTNFYIIDKNFDVQEYNIQNTIAPIQIIRDSAKSKVQQLNEILEDSKLHIDPNTSLESQANN